ncbi:hypothetical protein SORBI_3005G226350 [Sorghum bicolor]|uniref:Uncharacterized protein n=3 Tax=Sorghum bicolor TaxID=4558 RepID=A0A1Z5RKH9_SORBI|nr:hypothetical protein SORBI_3005G226350 [Sorghum bicolor]
MVSGTNWRRHRDVQPKFIPTIPHFIRKSRDTGMISKRRGSAALGMVPEHTRNPWSSSGQPTNSLTYETWIKESSN